jgi:hypothetical protein
MTKIYIVTRSGPEWNDLIRAFEDKRAAQHFADVKNETKHKGDIFEGLSDYVVTPLEFEAKA